MKTVERILVLMTQKNINEITLVKELGLANGIVGQWRRGKANPSSDAIVKIADYFQVSTDYLLGRDGFEKEKSAPVETEALSNQEVELLHNFRQLTDKNKELYLGYGKILLDSEKFTNLSKKLTN